MDFEAFDETPQLDAGILQTLAEKLHPYDPADLLAAIAGLQLLPENADRAVRLEAFAHIAASLDYEPDKPLISLHRLRQVANSEPLGKGFIAAQEDPCDNALTEAFTYHGGTFIVFPGIVDESTYILRHLILAILSHADAYPQDFVNTVDMLISAVLVLSNEIVHRAELGRGVMPIFLGREGDVIVPDSHRLTQLKEVVSFSKDELISLLTKRHIPEQTLERLIIPIGTVSLTDYQLDSGDLQTRPVVQVGERYIMAIPSMLLVAARHELLRLAFEYGIQYTLAQHYHQAIWHTVIQSLGFLHNISLPLSLSVPPNIPCCQGDLFNLDTDKLIYAILVTDSLEGYDLHHAFSTWPIEHVQAELEKHLRAAEEAIFSNYSPNEILFLVLFQQIGRSVFLHYRRLETFLTSLKLNLTAADLETIAFLEGGEQLTLWKYARLSSKASEHTHIVSTGELNEFYVYRKYGYSYFIPDKQKTSVIGMLPGGAGELRQEVIHQYDPHAVVSYLPGYVIDVIALHGTSTVPLYAPLIPHDRRAACLVEGLPLPIWIIGQIVEDNNRQDTLAFYQNIVQAIAYWLWQCTSTLHALLQPLIPAYPRVLIQCTLQSTEPVHQEEGHGETVTQRPIALTVDAIQGILSLAFAPTFINPLFATADNSGEREVMVHVLKGLRELLPETKQDALSDIAIGQILNRYAPLGLKKTFTYNMLNDKPDIDPRHLPPYRKVQKADENELLDELGSYLRIVEHIEPGPIPEDHGLDILNKAVTFFYQKLVKLLASLCPDGLLEFLITLQEAATRESSYRELTIPTQLACFSSEPEMIERLSKELPELATTAMASRFLIEYVAACPPQGLRLISLSVYDRLMALASHMIAFGQTSDMIHFQIADITIELLPSDRLYIDREQYEKALASYLPNMAASEIVRATEAFPQLWMGEENSERDTEGQNLWLQLDTAAQAEFGCPLSDLQKFMAAAYIISEDLDPAYACLPINEFVDRVVAYLTWSKAQVNQVFHFLNLSPRSNFLTPYSLFEKYTCPWRYNRQLSYVRRPFISRKQGDTIEILWGNRHLYRVIPYIADLCLTGRLHAQSNEMLQLMSTIRMKQANAFNDRVAEILKQNADLIVRTRVKKVGKLRPPGDIDILLADPKKRRLGILECKDFTLARTPRELDNELKKLFEGKHGKKSMIEQRVDWASANVEQILNWLQVDGADKASKWSVKPLIVVSQELFSPYLNRVSAKR
jgi:hypothetical protein